MSLYELGTIDRQDHTSVTEDTGEGARVDLDGGREHIRRRIEIAERVDDPMQNPYILELLRRDWLDESAITQQH